jgi:hypothetical protein
MFLIALCYSREAGEHEQLTYSIFLQVTSVSSQTIEANLFLLSAVVDWSFTFNIIAGSHESA